MLTVLFSLIAAACYGTADFCGGLASRASRVVQVLLTSHGSSLVLLLGAAFLLPPAHLEPRDWLFSLFAGVSCVVGLLALYRGLAGGRMAIVAAVSAVLSAIVPAMVGVFGGEQLPALGWVGLALGLAATVLVSLGSEAPAVDADPLWLTVVLSVVAGLGIGGILAFSAACSPGSGVWPIVVMRTLSVGVLALATAVILVRARGRERVRVLPARPVLAAIAGCLDVVGTVLFMQATHAGSVAVAAVLSAQYPLVTVALARGVLKERLARRQLVGLALALVSVGLLASVG